MNIWISLGSNLGDSQSLIRSALKALNDHPRLSFVRCSSLYRTSAWGMTKQPDFINAVAEFDSGLDAPATLAALLEIESSLGRSRQGPRWGPRKIDIDLLLYGCDIYILPELRVPHPRMHRRKFVLEPLAELQADLLIPARGTVASCLRRLARASAKTPREKVERVARRPLEAG